MSGKNGGYKTMRALAWITQFGLNMITPLVLCLIAASWLKNKFAVGDWIMLAAIAVGILCACASMYSFIKTVKNENRRDSDDEKDSDRGLPGGGG